MGKKAIALFVMCVMAMATLRGCSADEAVSPAKYKECFNKCQKDCQSTGNGYTFCEVKCDEECSDQESTDRLNGLF